MQLRPVTRSLILWIVLSTLLVSASWHFFSASFHEQGDIALNALQVDRAKGGGELYGNYSRFHFNHPGPAFFYTYAAAEVLFTDTLQVLAPHTAHTLAGVVLQCAFFVLGLHLLARQVAHPVFLPAALLIGAIHFSSAQAAFVSIWPPHVLLMPFFAFWSACVSVALGRGRDLPWLVVSACFLVHGHVAQPLFVTVLTVAAYVCLWRHQRALPGAPRPWAAWPWAHLLGLAIIALFVLPMAIDLAKGEASNISAILRHLEYAEDKKKFTKTLLYFLSFFAYLQNQDDVLRQLSWKSASFLADHWLLFTGWAALAALVLFSAVRGSSLEPAQRRFLRIGAAFWCLTALLCLYWGRMQSGPMFQFNGYFFHAVLYTLLLLGLAVLLRWVPRRLGWATGAVCLLIAVPVAVKGIRYPAFSTDESGINVRHQTRTALARDPAPGLPKMLVFSHPDWAEVASVALALTREGVPFYVDPSWTFMFQKQHEVPLAAVAEPEGKVSVWRFLHSTEDRGVLVARDLRIVFDVPELAPDGGQIDFSDTGDFEEHQLLGFSTPETGDYAPTSQKDAILQFRVPRTTKDVQINIEADPFVGAGNKRIQPTELRFNGVLVFSAPFTEPGVLRAGIPADMWNSRPVATIQLTLPNALSPAELGVSGDVRRLGLSVKRLTTRTVER